MPGTGAPRRRAPRLQQIHSRPPCALPSHTDGPIPGRERGLFPTRPQARSGHVAHADSGSVPSISSDALSLYEQATRKGPKPSSGPSLFDR